MTAPSDKAELLFLGRECHHPACYLNDFLPFSCPACHLSFCQPHFLPSQHSCSAPLPASMIDRIAPQCPLCNEVVPTAASRDPNESVERHILDGICIGLPGGEEKRKAELRGKKERGEVCWRKGCTKNLIVQMKCENCHHSFCPPHRHTTSHQCTPTSSRANTPLPPSAGAAAGPSRAPAAASAKAAMSRLLPGAKSSSPSSSAPSAPVKAPVVPVTASASAPSAADEPSKPLDARAAAAAAALKRAGKDVKANVPFVKTKTEKRADSELASQLQALKARHEKGLLSKTEELKYAEMLGKKESGRRKGQDKDGCCIC